MGSTNTIKEFMDKKIRKIEKEVKKGKIKTAGKELKSLERMDKKQDRKVAKLEKGAKRKPKGK